MKAFVFDKKGLRRLKEKWFNRGAAAQSDEIKDLKRRVENLLDGQSVMGYMLYMYAKNASTQGPNPPVRPKSGLEDLVQTFQIDDEPGAHTMHVGIAYGDVLSSQQHIISVSIWPGDLEP